MDADKLDQLRSRIAHIADHLERGDYRNEESVRFSLVGGILQSLGWAVWNPNEVRVEYLPVRSEDSTRVDIALFLTPTLAKVFIEVKAAGRLAGDISRFERQLRDYNRNHTAELSVLTDGDRWRFYLSQTGGTFHDKCFATVVLTDRDPDATARLFSTLLSREVIKDGTALELAFSRLATARKARALEEVFGKAQKLTLLPPFPSLPEALAELTKGSEAEATIEEAKRFAASALETRLRVEKQELSERASEIPRRRVDAKRRVTTNSSRTLPPDGTECRFTYKGSTFEGQLVGGLLVIDGLGRFSSFSAASRAATNTSRNGWTDWEVRVPGESGYKLADTWRKRKSH